jgi:hypothetical protein
LREFEPVPPAPSGTPVTSSKVGIPLSNVTSVGQPGGST